MVMATPGATYAWIPVTQSVARVILDGIFSALMRPTIKLIRRGQAASGSEMDRSGHPLCIPAGSTPGDKDDARRNESDTKPICEPQLFIQKSDAKDGDENNAQLIDGRYARRISQLQGTEIANP
jgi:hypothetical protein